MHAHEEAFIRAFLTAAYRARCLAKKGIPREDLNHVVGSKLDRRRALELPSARWSEVLSILSDLGDFDSGYCISSWTEWDDRVISLDEFWEIDDATVVSFVAGELAYFQEESYQPTPRYLLVGDPALRRKVRRRIRP